MGQMGMMSSQTGMVVVRVVSHLRGHLHIPDVLSGGYVYSTLQGITRKSTGSYLFILYDPNLSIIFRCSVP